MALQLTRPAVRPAVRLQVAELLPVLTAATLAAAGLELVLLRLLSRIAVHIPNLPALRRLYSGAVYTGIVAFPVAALLAAALVLAVAVTVARRFAVAALPVPALLAVQGWLLVSGESAAGTAAVQWLLAVALLAAVLQRAGRHVALLAALLAVAQALGLAQAASANLAALGGRPLPVALAGAGEALLLGALLGMPLLVGRGRWGRRSLVAGAVALLLVSTLLLGNASTIRILALWTFGLGMPLPALAYAVVAAVITATITELLHRGRRQPAVALVLIILGGFVPANSYQACLALSGLLLLSGGVAREEARG